jgi:hypothetical protein
VEGVRFDLMLRSNFKDLIFFRPGERLIYPHIDALFGERGRNVIDWKLIERHWQDLMQVAVSISEGRLSSATLMRRLRSNSRKNRIYKVFREVGRSVRPVALLRYLADPQLRARITAATNKVSSSTTGSPTGSRSATTAGPTPLTTSPGSRRPSTPSSRKSTSVPRASPPDVTRNSSCQPHAGQGSRKISPGR